MTKVVLPKENQSGVNEWADVEDNDKAIRDVVNGELEDDNIAEGANIDLDKLAAGNVEAGVTLRVVRGSVSGATGAKVAGEGFTGARNSKGVYTITFDAEFDTVPILAFTASEFNRVANIGEVTKKTAKVSFVDLGESAGDTNFHMIAIG